MSATSTTKDVLGIVIALIVLYLILSTFAPTLTIWKLASGLMHFLGI